MSEAAQDIAPRASLSLDALKHAPLALRDRDDPASGAGAGGGRGGQLPRAIALEDTGGAAAYFQLHPGVDLNVPPPNWLQSRLPDGTLVPRGGAAAIDSIAASPGGAAGPLLGHVDFVAPAAEMKKILTMPYSGAQVSLAVFRVGETLVVAADGAGCVGAGSGYHGGGSGVQLPRPALLAAPVLLPPPPVAASVVKKNPAGVERRELYSKFMYRSTLAPAPPLPTSGGAVVSALAPATSLVALSLAPGAAASAVRASGAFGSEIVGTLEASGARTTTAPAPTLRAPSSPPPPPPPPPPAVGVATGGGGGLGTAAAAAGSSDASSAPFRRVSQWQLDGLSLVLGSDLLTFRNEVHGAVSLRLHDISEPMPLSETLDMYLDNVMADVPAAAICYHSRGLVEAYQVVPTPELPNIGGEPFSPYVLEANAATLLRFLQANCTRDCGSYWLFRPAGGNVAQLYDLSVLSAANNRSRYLIAMLCLRVASQLRRVAEAAPGEPVAVASGCGSGGGGAGSPPVSPPKGGAPPPPPMGSGIALARQRELLLKSAGLLEELLRDAGDESSGFYSALLASVRIELAGACEALALREHAHLDATTLEAPPPPPPPPPLVHASNAPQESVAGGAAPRSPLLVARPSPGSGGGSADGGGGGDALARYCSLMNDAAHHVIGAMAELRRRIARAAAPPPIDEARATPPSSPPRGPGAGGAGASVASGGGGDVDPVVSDALEALAGLRARLVSCVTRIVRALVREGRPELAWRALEDALSVCAQRSPAGGTVDLHAALPPRSLMELCGAAGDLAHTCAPGVAAGSAAAGGGGQPPPDPARFSGLLALVRATACDDVAQLPTSLTALEAVAPGARRCMLAFEVLAYAAAVVAAARQQQQQRGAAGSGNDSSSSSVSANGDGVVFNRRLGDALNAWASGAGGGGGDAAAAYVRGGVAFRAAGDAVNAARLFCNASHVWVAAAREAHGPPSAPRAPRPGERNQAIAYASRAAAAAAEALDGHAVPPEAGRAVLEATARISHLSGAFAGQDAEREAFGSPEERDASVRRACAMLEHAGALYGRLGAAAAAASCELQAGLALAAALRHGGDVSGAGDGGAAAAGARRRRYGTLAERHLAAAEAGGWAARDAQMALLAALACAWLREGAGAAGGAGGGGDMGAVTAAAEAALEVLLTAARRLDAHRRGGSSVRVGAAVVGGDADGAGAQVREVASEAARLAQRLAQTYSRAVAAAAAASAGTPGGGGGGAVARRAAARDAHARAVLKALLPALRRGAELRDVEAALVDAAAVPQAHAT
jgi:hypothetical protein